MNVNQDLQSRQAFYMVFVQGQSTPAVQHNTHNAALAEAVRLSERMNRPAWVLKATTCVQPRFTPEIVPTFDIQ